MTPEGLEEFRVFPLGSTYAVHVPYGRGDELRRYLSAHGVTVLVSPAAETPYERLEVEGDVDPERLQTLIDAWKR